jgi:glutathione S-transferase
VPVLKVDQKEVIFESAVIAELLDDLIEPRLQHVDPILRAKEKSWIEYGSSLLAAQYELTRTTDPRTAQTLLLEFNSDLGRLEPVLGSGPYFRGTQFSLMDAAYAPLFMRMKLLPGLYDSSELAKTSKIRAWAETLLAMPEVKDSVLLSFQTDYLELLKQSGSALVRDL